MFGFSQSRREWYITSSVVLFNCVLCVHLNKAKSSSPHMAMLFSFNPCFVRALTLFHMISFLTAIGHVTSDGCVLLKSPLMHLCALRGVLHINLHLVAFMTSPAAYSSYPPPPLEPIFYLIAFQHFSLCLVIIFYKYKIHLIVQFSVSIFCIFGSAGSMWEMNVAQLNWISIFHCSTSKITLIPIYTRYMPM